MKRSLYVFSKSIILACLIVQSSGYAQKYDNNWLIGYDSDIPNPPPYNNDFISFKDDSVFVIEKKTSAQFALSMDISMSDSLGNFLFYSDGCKIFNANNIVFTNGTGLNPGETATSLCPGYPIPMGAICFPSPGKQNEFDLITYFADETLYGTRPVNLLSHHIVFENGVGKLTYKNISILADTFTNGNLMGCKHANGEDWWIIVPRYKSNDYYKILLNKDGFQTPQKQSIGPPYDPGTDWSGEAGFSPDGKYYARVDRGNPLTIFNFDRCDGSLSNPQSLKIKDSTDSLTLGGGLAFSPSSKFLYVLSGLYIYQFDMESNDILASSITVGNGWDSNYTANFFLAQLAPDNKIYMSAAGGIMALHVIENPDLKGKACNVNEYGLQVPRYSGSTLPFYPNYRLGPIICDSVTQTTEKVESSNFSIIPNPAYNNVEIRNNRLKNYGDLEFIISSLSGQRIIKKQLNDKKQLNLDISNILPGFYIWQIIDSRSVLQNGKLIILR